jgi:hypothetical protein
MPYTELTNKNYNPLKTKDLFFRFLLDIKTSYCYTVYKLTLRGNDNMNDLFEIVQDLEDIAEFGSDTASLYTVEDVLAKWKARLLEAQDAAERQEAV